LLSEKDKFYEELKRIIGKYLLSNRIDADNDILQEIFKYQIAIIPAWGKAGIKREEFNYDIPSYFPNLCTENAEMKAEIRKNKQSVTFGADSDRWASPAEFARSRLVSGNIFNILGVKIKSSANKLIGREQK
jgi:hypothetical protein